MVIEGNRIILRTWKEEDVKGIVQDYKINVNTSLKNYSRIYEKYIRKEKE